jgi:hypothetical protein
VNQTTFGQYGLPLHVDPFPGSPALIFADLSAATNTNAEPPAARGFPPVFYLVAEYLAQGGS